MDYRKELTKLVYLINTWDDIGTEINKPGNQQLYIKQKAEIKRFARNMKQRLISEPTKCDKNKCQ